LQTLARHIPEAGPTLHFKNPFELLIAVILSAQCTDIRVKQTTARLFAKYKTPVDFASLSPEHLAGEIKECGLHRSKSLHIIKTCRLLEEKYGGQVPEDPAVLQSLPGVGRKTANVVLNVAFGKPTFPVDTHIFRVARRLGLSGGSTPLRVEKDLTHLIPPADRGVWHHRLIKFGRATCSARNPKCYQCPVCRYCRYPKNKVYHPDKES